MELFTKVNVYLANLTILYKKVQNLHWNIKGKEFFGLHQKYDDIYNELQDKVDEVAERILAKGHTPVSNYREVLEIATIKERESSDVACEEAVKIFLKDLEAIIKDSYELADLCSDEGDCVSEDLFIGYIKDFEKHRWMFQSVLSGIKCKN